MLMSARTCLLAHLSLVLVEASMLTFTTSVRNSSMPDRVPISLDCPLGAWLHVNSVAHSRPVGCGASPAPRCQDSVEMSPRPINKECVGRTTCWTYSNVQSRLSSSFELQVHYECVNRNRFSFCDSTVTDAVYTSAINLHSPSYPPGRVKPDPCYCRILGSNLTATAYEIDFRDGIGKLVYTGMRGARKPDYRVGQYDVVLSSGSNSLTLGYYGGTGVVPPAWINVEDTGTMRVSCGIMPTLTFGVTLKTTTISTATSTTTSTPTSIPTSTPTSTPTTSTYSKPRPTGTSSTTTNESLNADIADIPVYTIATLSGGGMILLATIIAFTAMYIICYKRRQSLKTVPKMENQAAEDDIYLELVNTPNNYSKLYGVTPPVESTYTDIHVYQES